MSIGALKRQTQNFLFNIVNFNFARWHGYEHENWDLLDAILGVYVSTGGLKGIWKNSTIYAVSDRVIDTNTNDLWLCLVGHTSAAEPTTFAAHRAANPTHWRSITYDPSFRGQWVTATAYNINDFITDQGRYGVAKTDFISGASYNADVAAGRIITLIDTSTVTSHGDCRLTYISNTQLRLIPLNGNKLTISGLPQTIPAAGVNLNNTGLAGSTFYYCYAYMNAGVMTLEASATAYAHDATNGMPVKIGDSSRTLVGKFFTDAGTPGIFQDIPAKRYVGSYFNRRDRSLMGVDQAGATTTSTTFTEVGAGGGRVYFIAWGDDDVSCGVSGSANVSLTAGNAVFVGAALNSNTTVLGTPGCNQPATAGYSLTITCMAGGTPLDNALNYITGMWRVTAGTGGLNGFTAVGTVRS